MFSFLNIQCNTASDEDLMAHLAQGKEKAFDELYKRYSRKMLFFFYQMLYQDNEKAKDFLQDLFLKIIEKPQLFDASKKFSTWIYAIASNMCKNEYRRNAIRGAKINDFDLNEILDVSPTVNMPDRFDQALFNSELTKELDTLDENQSLTFVLRYKENLSIKEISEVLSCSEGTVKSRLFYTIKKLSIRLRIFNPYLEIK